MKKKKRIQPPFAPVFPPFWGGSSAANPIEIWDVMPPYLKTLFEQKNRNLIILTIFAQTTPLSWHMFFFFIPNCRVDEIE